MTYICAICKKKFKDFGNNAEPLAEGLCCEECNLKVIEERIRRMNLQDGLQS